MGTAKDGFNLDQESTGREKHSCKAPCCRGREPKHLPRVRGTVPRLLACMGSGSQLTSERVK